VVRDPEAPVRLEKDRVAVDGQQVSVAEKVYLMLNKPRGVVTTAADEKNRQTVYEFLAKGTSWVAPVGRLDKASEGLLLLTNDSEWAARVLDPETHLDKTYHVQVGVLADDVLVHKMKAGVASEGELLLVKQVRILRSGEKNCWLEVALDEGRNRQIRRIMEALQIKVLRLVRVAIGPLALEELAKGEVRMLTVAEKREMDQAMSERGTE